MSTESVELVQSRSRCQKKDSSKQKRLASETSTAKESPGSRPAEGQLAAHGFEAKWPSPQQYI